MEIDRAPRFVLCSVYVLKWNCEWPNLKNDMCASRADQSRRNGQGSAVIVTNGIAWSKMLAVS